MAGLVFLAIVIVWLWVASHIARTISTRVVSKWPRVLTMALLFVALAPLPVADELIAAPFFRKMCEEGVSPKFTESNLRGRTIYPAKIAYPYPEFRLLTLKGYYIPWRYNDAATGASVITYNSYHTKGGLLIQILGISETTDPLTFKGYCGPKEEAWQKTFLQRYDLKYVERESVQEWRFK